MTALRRWLGAAILVLALGFGVEALLLVLQQPAVLLQQSIRGGHAATPPRTCGIDQLRADSVVLRSRRIDVDANPSELDIRVAVVLDTAGRCQARLVGATFDPAWQDFLRAAVGRFLLSGQEIDPEDWQAQPVRLVDSTLHVVLQTSLRTRGWYDLTWRPDSTLTAASDSALIHPHDMLNSWVIPRPDRVEDSLVVFAGITLRQGPALHLGFRPAGEFRTTENYSMVLSRIGYRFPPEALRALFLALITIVPLPLYLLWDRGERDDREVLHRVAVAGVASVLVIGLANSAASLDYATRWLPRLSDTIETLVGTLGLTYRWHPALGAGFDLSLALVLGTAVPVVILRYADAVTGAGRKTSALPTVVVSTLLLLGVVGSAALALLAPDATMGMILLPLGLAGLALVLASLGALVRIAAGAWLGFGALAGAAVGIVLLASLSRADLLHGVWSALAWLLITIVIGYVTVSSYWRLFDAGMRGLSGPAGGWWAKWPRGRVLACLMLALPVGPLLREDSDFTTAYNGSTAGGIAFVLPALALLCWLALGLAYLWREGRSGSAPSVGARIVGATVVATLIFPPRMEWLGLPLTFGVGAAILWWLLIKHRPVEPAPAPGAPAEDRSAVADLIALRLAQQGLRAIRRSRADQLRKGELDLEKYVADINTAAASVEAFRAKTRSGPPSFERGPRATAWENGLYGAGVAGLLALPWLILGVQDLLTQNASWLYPHWALAYGLTTLVARWVAPGFLLGYFFPVLPGRTGLGKALILCAAWIAPLVPFVILDRATAGLTLVNAAQAFVQLSLLGMFGFDFMILRSRGLGDWRAVFDLHGLAGLGVSVSTVLLALGTTLLTLLSSQFTTLLTSAMKLLLPSLNVPTPGQ